MKQLWNHISIKRKTQFYLVLILMFIASVAEIMSISAILPFLAVITEPAKLFNYPSMQLVNNFFGFTSSNDIIFPVTLAFIIASLLAGIIRLLLLYATTKLSYGTGHDLSVDIYKKTLYQKYSVHVNRNSSEIINGIIVKTSTIISGIVTPILTLISSIVITVGIVGLLCFIDFFVALSSFLGFGIIYIFIIYYTRKKMKSNSHVIAQKSTNMVKALQEGLRGIRDVILHDCQQFYLQVYRKADLPLRNASGNNLFISGCPRFAMESIGMTLIALIAYFMTQNTYSLYSSLPILGALALGAQRLLPVMQQAYASYTIMKGSKASLDDINQLLAQTFAENKIQKKIIPFPFTKKIELENVSFRYSDKEPWILDSVNITINKGLRVGIIGDTGSGKTTLCDIIIGLFSPTKGFLKIDENKISENNLRSWQSNISHVPQDIYLLDNTILENIAFGLPMKSINIDKAKKAAKDAQISEMIEKLDKKYETIVGEHGVRLSGGQRQRLGIARALYKNATVLIFDEATSALDTKTEKTVVEAIEGLNKDLTILLIAHRLTTLKKCDLIVEVKNKKITILDKLP